MYNCKDIIEATGGHAATEMEWTATGISIDSRTIQPGELFIAIKGEHCDGHRFVEDALARGAVAAIVQEEVAQSNVIRVEDSFAALWDIARYNRARSTAKIIGITGSVGKTGTKELLAMALEKRHRVYYTKGNLNNHFGLPLCLANMPSDTQYGIFELGMSAAGEIEALSLLLQPDISLITTIAPAHLEHFNSVEEIALAKAEIARGTKDTVILPADSEYFELLKAECRDVKVLTFGETETADVHGLIRADESVCAGIGDFGICYRLATRGKHWVNNSLAVLAVAFLLGEDVQQVADDLMAFSEPEGRGKIHEIEVKGGTFTLIDDSYNASPLSMKAGLETLSVVHGLSKGRKIAVLGDMLELGEQSVALHIQLAQEILKHHLDEVFTVGKDIEYLQDILPESIRGGHCDTVEELLPKLRIFIRPDDTVLVKGSNGIGLSQITRCFMENV